jgi:hypothetical protein
MLIRDIIARLRHDGCGGRAGKVELLTGIEGASSRRCGGSCWWASDVGPGPHPPARPHRRLERAGAGAWPCRSRSPGSTKRTSYSTRSPTC